MKEQNTSRIYEIPYDILLRILTNLSATDVVRFLSLSRTLHSQICDDRIWKHRSATSGVSDPMFLGHRTYYTVYTQLLYVYAPLIGVWAGDHPYTGGIIEFRWESGTGSNTGCIIGDVWDLHTSDSEEADGLPQQPQFAAAMKIGFAGDMSDEHRKALADNPHPDQVVALCCKPEPPSCRAHTVDLNIMGATRQSAFMSLPRDGVYRHPDFPSEEVDMWRDDTRPFPRFRVQEQRAVNQISSSRTYLRLLPIMITAPTSYLKPRALTMTCALSRCEGLKPPTRWGMSAMPYAPRYYPLRVMITKGVDPTSEDWTPTSLTGLWLASYRPHGTECIMAHWDERKQAMLGIKITGDQNVPRGTISWEVDMASQTPYEPDERRDILARLPTDDSEKDERRYQLFRGKLLASNTGHILSDRWTISIVMVVVAPDRFHILSLATGRGERLLSFVRYPGRSLHI
ncbi:hypothetical protein WOLCODRAFT_107578 [Wolfiporia cocos MD-104 SS10]|uniref:F-box domain-containing protein n=1 Tax=Wolfiporia cocos (strain MD-104) TaxID=742152 RepID=A0A2H3J0A8_WOLCO|nr:hypothetical protein WOLCODRAFT_107578 [Wolfiporia cocos MD-104 SS10]